MNQGAAAPRNAVLRGMGFIAVSGLLFTLLNTIMRQLTHELDPLQVQFLRYLMGLVVMLPFMLRSGLMAWMPHNLRGQVWRG